MENIMEERLEGKEKKKKIQLEGTIMRSTSLFQ